MTLQQHRMLKAAWVVFCVSLAVGAGVYFGTIELGVYAGIGVMIVVGLITYGENHTSLSGAPVHSTDSSDSDSSPWLISDETFDDPGWSSVAGNVWHD